MKLKKAAEPIVQYLETFNSLASIATHYQQEIMDAALPAQEDKPYYDEIYRNKSLQKSLFSYEMNTLTKPIIGYQAIFVAYILWKK